MNNVSINSPSFNVLSGLVMAKNTFMFMGLACFTLSLFLPVFFTSAQQIYGIWVLLTGWLGLVFIQFAWFANPLNLLALLLATKSPVIAISLSILALVLASGTVFFYEIPVGIDYEKVFIREYGLGFYIWYLAQVFFLLALLCRYFNYRNSKSS